MSSIMLRRTDKAVTPGQLLTWAAQAQSMRSAGKSGDQFIGAVIIWRRPGRGAVEIWNGPAGTPDRVWDGPGERAFEVFR